MSTDEDPSGRTSAPSQRNGVEQSSETPPLEQNKSSRNTATLLRHQHSFEARYSNIIQNQIWETTINKIAMERQINDYFPFARSASITRPESDCSYDLLDPMPGSSESSLKVRSLGTTPTKHRSEDCLENFNFVNKTSQD